MNLTKSIVILVILAVVGFGLILFSQNKQVVYPPNSLPPITPTPATQATVSPTPYPSYTRSEIQSLLAKKYNKSVSEVNVSVTKEVPGFSAGGVVFGQGGPGEGGVWLAKKVGNIWEIIFDGNGSIDCKKMRQEYGFPDTILKPNYCD